MSKICGVAIAVMCMAITGCGDSTPIPAQSGASLPGTASTPTARAEAYAASSAAFLPISPAELANSVQISSCNVDQVNGQPANGVPLDHMGTGTLSGWAADGVTRTVPSNLRVLLLGARNFAVPAKTGELRRDVAAGTGVPAFVTSGFKVNADMDAVPVGEYRVAMLYDGGGKQLLCNTDVKLSVQ